MKRTDSKKKIAKAFEKLLKDRPLEKVTVGAVSDLAGISRQTFYYHFDNIYEVYVYIIKSSMKHYGKKRTIFVSVTEVCQSFTKYSEMTYAFLRIGYRHQMMDTLRDSLQLVLETNMKGRFADGEVPDYIPSLARFISEGYCGTIRDWIDAGMEYDIEPRLDELHAGMRDFFKNSGIF